MQCAKCKIEMTKTSVMHSGNSKFQGYRCSQCHMQTSQAIGLIGGMPK